MFFFRDGDLVFHDGVFRPRANEFIEDKNPSVLYGCDKNGLPILYTAMGAADLQARRRRRGVSSSRLCGG